MCSSQLWVTHLQSRLRHPQQGQWHPFRILFSRFFLATLPFHFFFPLWLHPTLTHALLHWGPLTLKGSCTHLWHTTPNQNQANASKSKCIVHCKGQKEWLSQWSCFFCDTPAALENVLKPLAEGGGFSYNFAERGVSARFQRRFQHIFNMNPLPPNHAQVTTIVQNFLWVAVL